MLWHVEHTESCIYSRPVWAELLRISLLATTSCLKFVHAKICQICTNNIYLHVSGSGLKGTCAHAQNHMKHIDIAPLLWPKVPWLEPKEPVKEIKAHLQPVRKAGSTPMIAVVGRWASEPHSGCSRNLGKPKLGAGACLANHVSSVTSCILLYK